MESSAKPGEFVRGRRPGQESEARNSNILDASADVIEPVNPFHFG
jgi:hypothetical protein